MTNKEVQQQLTASLGLLLIINAALASYDEQQQGLSSSSSSSRVTPSSASFPSSSPLSLPLFEPPTTIEDGFPERRHSNKWSSAIMTASPELHTFVMSAAKSMDAIIQRGGSGGGLHAASAATSCPNSTWRTAVESTGLLSVKLFGAVGNGSTHDDSDAVRRTINASKLCGGCVFFPPGSYFFNTTVQLAGCVKGSMSTPGAGTDDMGPPQVSIAGADGLSSTVVIQPKSGAVYLQDVTVYGDSLAIWIRNVACVRFVNVGAHVSRDVDHVNASRAGCNATGCNVRLGSMNAAMVVENSFWLWFERVSFSAQSISGSCPPPGAGFRYKCATQVCSPALDCQWGQRPTVILRGRWPYPGEDYGPAVATVYLVRFDKATFVGGGIQYQQLRNNTSGSVAGWFDIVSSTLEVAGTPLLDLQSDPSFTGYFQGLNNVNIRDFMNADAVPPRFGAPSRAVVSINCSAVGCKFDGLTVSSSGLLTPTAVRVYAGDVVGTTLLTDTGNTYGASSVSDSHNRPVGTWKQSYRAGWLMCGTNMTPALTFQVSGETRPRKVLYADGSEEFLSVLSGGATSSNGAPASRLHGHLTNVTAWDPPRLAHGQVATLNMPLHGAAFGDALSCGHSAIDPLLHTVQITATAGTNMVKAVLQNLEDTDTDIPLGLLRVVAVKMQ